MPSARGHLTVTDSSPAEELLTGERTWPGIPSETYWFMRHLACYRWVAGVIEASVAAGTGNILDAGSGEGYGSAALGEHLRRCVVAVELDSATAAHAAATYPSLAQTVANLIALPFRNDAFAGAVSLQVVEHIWDPVTYLREVARCTRGPVVISTPNRLTHSPGLGRGERPDNPFHVREFDSWELVELLTKAVPERMPALYGVHHGTRIRQWEVDNGPLPSSLLESAEGSAAFEFALTVTTDDFTVEKVERDESSRAMQDLVAIW